MVTEISISENFLDEYLPRATIEILPPLPCDNFYLPDCGRHVTSVHQGLSQAGAGEEPGYEVGGGITLLEEVVDKFHEHPRLCATALFSTLTTNQSNQYLGRRLPTYY